MKRQIIICLVVLMGIFKTVNAQNENDAIRYSLYNYEGTAQFQGMSGAMSTLDGDLSSVSLNPATLGFLKYTQFSFAPSFSFSSITNNYLDQSYVQDKTAFNFRNAGMAFKSTPISYDWNSSAFAIGYNRLGNFNGLSFLRGTVSNSLLDTYINDINSSGGMPSSELSKYYPFTAHLAYETYLINPDTSNPNFYTHVMQPYPSMTHQLSSLTTGGMGELYLAYAGNYSDQLSIGAGIYFPMVNYYQRTVYAEINDSKDSTTGINDWNMRYKLSTDGMGFNFKVGMIYKPVNWLRFGLSFHSPTFFSLTDNWDVLMNSSFDTASYEWQSPYGRFDYKLRTPFRIITGLSLSDENLGRISIDYEYVDYSRAFLSPDNNGLYSFSTENNRIQSRFGESHTIRAGVEANLSQFRFRAGYMLGTSVDRSVNYLNRFGYSAGFGIVFNDVSALDFAYNFQKINSVESIDPIYNSATQTIHYNSFIVSWKWFIY